MSRAFRLVLRAQEKLYSAGLLRTHRLDHPVISVGNLTMGGTGKTPLVIFLAERLLAEGFRPVILSRGYRRKTHGVLIVGRGSGPIVDWQDSGDEPWLMAQRLRHTAVVVGEDRYLAGRRAQEENLGDLFILDDGFQHRRLHRDFDIVTIDPAEWDEGEVLIPMGRWREPKSAIERADAACIQRNGELQDPAVLPIPSFKVGLTVDGIFDRDNRPVAAEDLRRASIVAFAGIGKPDRFFTTLRNLGLNLAKCVSFRDHHAFGGHELNSLGGDVRITTEKDAVRITDRTDFLRLRVSATISDFERLRGLIHARLVRNAIR